MKKIIYQTPESKIIELKHRTALLQNSDPVGGGGGTGHAPEFDPEDI